MIITSPITPSETYNLRPDQKPKKTDEMCVLSAWRGYAAGQACVLSCTALSVVVQLC